MPADIVKEGGYRRPSLLRRHDNLICTWTILDWPSILCDAWIPTGGEIFDDGIKNLRSVLHHVLENSAMESTQLARQRSVNHYRRLHSFDCRTSAHGFLS